MLYFVLVCCAGFLVVLLRGFMFVFVVLFCLDVFRGLVLGMFLGMFCGVCVLVSFRVCGFVSVVCARVVFVLVVWFLVCVVSMNVLLAVFATSPPLS